MTEKQDETRRRNLKNYDTEVQRSRRNRQLKTEEGLARQLRDDGWVVLSPTVVCDRIGIKNGWVYFVEFKKKGQTLREGQRKISELAPDNYRVVYY